MKNLTFILLICFGLFSCQKEVIKPISTEANTDTLEVGKFVLVSFNDIMNGGLDSVYIFRNDVFVKTIAVGCGNSFKAELYVNYSFKKRYKNTLIPLYGHQTTTDTYLKFLTTSTKPKNCIDYIQSGLLVGTVIDENELKCDGVHYTLNSWF